MAPAGFTQEIHRALQKGVPAAGVLVIFAHIFFIGADLGFPGIYLPDFIRHRLVWAAITAILTALSLTRWGRNRLPIKILGFLIILLCGASISTLTRMTGGSVSPYWTMLMLTFFGATLLLRFSVTEAAVLYLLIVLFHTGNMLVVAGDNYRSAEFLTSVFGIMLAFCVSLTGNWYIRGLQLSEFQSRQSLAEANEQLKASVTELEYKRQQAELRHLQNKLDLANDLHDTVGAQLSQIAVMAELPRIEATAHLRALAGATLENVRNFAHILKGEERVATLSAQLKRLVHSLRALGRYTVELHLPEGEIRLSDVALLNIDRILSEWTANVIRHAHATAFAIGARSKHGRTLIWFYQDKTPFTWRGTAERGGLKSIAMRAKNIGAQVHVRRMQGGAILVLRTKAPRQQADS